MKKLLLPAILGFAGLISAPAYALEATANFDVQINLYPKCILAISAAVLEVEYISFQTHAVEKDLPFTVQCTNGIAYELTIEGNEGAAGTLVGIPYALSVETATGTADGSAESNNIRINIAGNLGGTCNADNTALTGTQQIASAGAGGATPGNGTACSGTSTAGDHVLKVVY